MDKALEMQLKAHVDEAISLRFQDNDIPISSPANLIDSLLLVRKRLDRVEELLQILTRARGRALRASQEAERAAQEAWDQASVASRTGPSRRSEYDGARANNADNNLATLSQQRHAFQAKRVFEFVHECYQVVKTVYYGLDNFRQDHLAIIRAMSFESHLERTSTDRGY